MNLATTVKSECVEVANTLVWCQGEARVSECPCSATVAARVFGFHRRLLFVGVDEIIMSNLVL